MFCPWVRTCWPHSLLVLARIHQDLQAAGARFVVFVILITTRFWRRLGFIWLFDSIIAIDASPLSNCTGTTLRTNLVRSDIYMPALSVVFLMYQEVHTSLHLTWRRLHMMLQQCEKLFIRGRKGYQPASCSAQSASSGLTLWSNHIFYVRHDV